MKQEKQNSIAPPLNSTNTVSSSGNGIKETGGKLNPSEAEISNQVKEFQQAGGRIQQLPAERAYSMETVTIAKQSKKERAGVMLSMREKEKIPKSERLATRLNIKSSDFQSVSRGSGAGSKPPTPGEIHAALANQDLREDEEALFVYFHTMEPRYRSAAWALLMCRLADLEISEEWIIKKRGILEAMSNTALENLLYPQKFKHYSQRDWAHKLGLESHKNWSRTWKNRYNDLMNHAGEILARAHNMIAANH